MIERFRRRSVWFSPSGFPRCGELPQQVFRDSGRPQSHCNHQPHVGGRRPQIPLRGTVAGFETRREEGLAPLLLEKRSVALLRSAELLPQNQMPGNCSDPCKLVPGPSEAIIHAVRHLISSKGSDAGKIMLNVDFRTSSTGPRCWHRPSPFPWTLSVGTLLLRNLRLSSSELSNATGVQQGDPLGEVCLFPQRKVLQLRCVQPLTMFLRSPPCRGGPGHSLRRIASG